MKFGAIAVIIGVIVIIIGFAAPTMQIAGAATTTQPPNTFLLTTTQSVYNPGTVIPVTLTWTFEIGNLTTNWYVVYPFKYPSNAPQNTEHLFTAQLTSKSANGSYTFDFTHTTEIGTYEFYVTYTTLRLGEIRTFTAGSTFVYVNSTPISYQSPFTILNLSGTPNPAKVGQFVTFNANVIGAGGKYNPIQFEVNGSTTADIVGSSTTLTGGGSAIYKFPSSGLYTITAVITVFSESANSYVHYYKSFTEVVYPNYTTPPNIAKPPVINSVSGTPNPGTVGNYVTFNASINWYNQVGSVIWEVNGISSYANHYAFPNAGAYSITVIAKDSYGSVFKTFTEVVGSLPTATITSVSGTPNPAIAGQTVTFTGNVNWNGQTGNTEWEVNGQVISGNTYVFNTAGTYTVTFVATNDAGSSSNSFSEVVNPVSSSTPGPVIVSASGTPNPAKVGDTVTFSANVNWNDDIGTLTWEVNGQAISGDIYTFNSAINYTITVVASNNVGTTTYTFSEVVNTISTPTPVTVSLKNIGTFYMVANGKIYELNGRANVNITTTKYVVPATIYYVENNGTTQGLSGITIDVNSNTYTLETTNVTNYDGHTAYSMALNFESGNYTLTGYLHETSNPTSIQAFSLEVNNLAPATPATPLQQATSHFTSEINYTAIIVGIIIMIGGVVLIRFGI